MTEIRNSISSWLDQTEANTIIKTLTFQQCSYLQSVYKLETLRVVNCPTAQSYQQIFQYLEDTTIQKDKAGTWYCISCMARKIFAIYLDVVDSLPKTPERDQDLESMVQFLLVKFNHINKKLRPLADQLLTKLMERFPYLLWSERTLRCIMDITELLASSLNMDTNQVAPEFDVPGLNVPRLKVLDTLDGRESTVNDFTQRSSTIVQEALEFAPITAKAHIQNYMLQLQLRGENVYSHSGVSMMLDCLMKYSKPRADIESLDSATLNRRPDCIKKDFAGFIGQMNEKYNFVGVVQGMLSKSVNEESSIVRQLVHEMRQSSSGRLEKQLKNALLKAAAFLTLVKFQNNNTGGRQSITTMIKSTLNVNFERELLHEISVACCQLFTKQVVQVCIDCWSWIISSRPDIEPLVVEEMLNAWQMSVDLRMGMFAEQIDEPNPLAKGERDVLKPQPPANVDSHRIWIRYLHERLDIAKYKSEFELELFFYLMHKTLAFSTEKIADSALNRHISCIGLRFRLLNMALSLVQIASSSSNTHSHVLSNTVSKWILRERVYYTALDYFASRAHRAPTQTSVELREDIKHLLEFWNKIVAEKKYLKEENFFPATSNVGGGGTIGSGATIIVNTGGSGTPDANSVTGVDLTTGGGNTNGITALTPNTNGLNPALGTSITYTSASGIPPSTSNANINGASDMPAGSALSQLVASSGIFLEPSIAVANIGAVNPQPIPRADSTLFSSKSSSNGTATLQVNKNPNVYLNTLSKRASNSLTLPLMSSNNQSGVNNSSSKFNMTHSVDQQQLNYQLAAQQLAIIEQQRQQQQIRFFKDFSKKRSLLLHLLSHELDHLYTFYNPLNSQALSFDRIDTAINHLKIALSEKQWIENVRIAWSVQPALAVYLPTRFATESAVLKETQRLVKQQPDRVMHLAYAAILLACETNILNDSAELNNLLVWNASLAPINALAYFGKGTRGQSLAHPITAQFACKNLMKSRPETLINYIPQLVQALRYDDFGFVLL